MQTHTQETNRTDQPASAPGAGSAIDMPGAAFDVETELEILMEAQRLIQSNAVERIGWHTWDSWAGRQEYHEETTENWLRRILRKAMSTVLPNAGTHAPATKKL
jgi:hypothetical protein